MHAASVVFVATRQTPALSMGHLHNVGSSLKMQIQMVVHDDDVDQVIDAIMRSARTGRAGDGHVCVTSIEHRYNICTGQRDVS